MGTQSRLVLIEGLPGSGKTSLAEWLCAQIEAQGISASWIPELQRDHPVIDRPTMRTARVEGYADRCVQRWEAFARAVGACESPRAFLVEGCLFQSTVRFLVEYERADDEIFAYLPAVEQHLAPLHPVLVYLTQPDPVAYLERDLLRRKGEAIVSRIAAYSATTPYSVTRRLSGSSALVSLYSTYRNVCDTLVRHSPLPLLEVDAVRLSEEEVRARVGPWVTAAVGS